MKRYIIFGHSDDWRKGGLKDYIGETDSLTNYIPNGEWEICEALDTTDGSVYKYSENQQWQRVKYIYDNDG